MSDGGAGAIVKVVSLLGRTKAGRVVLVVLAAYLTLQYVIAKLSAALLAALAVIGGGVVALGVSYLIDRKRRRERASLQLWLLFTGLALVAGLGALFLIARRRRVRELSPPPSVAEIERLAAQEAQP